MRWRGIRGGSRLFQCPQPSPDSHVRWLYWQISFFPGCGRCGAGARFQVTALPEQAQQLPWAAPGSLPGSSSWEAS